MKYFNNEKYSFSISFLKIDSDHLYDLLNNRNKEMALKDKNNKVQIYNLTEIKINSIQQMNNIIEFSNKIKTIHNTIINETSSRSHSICKLKNGYYLFFEGEFEINVISSQFVCSKYLVKKLS